MQVQKVKKLLDDLYYTDYNVPFLEDDPVQIPHQFNKLQDKEIVAFWTAMLAWGQRKTIINKSKELFELMDNQPYQFVLNLDDTGRKRLANFKHRTFNYTDTLYFLEYFHRYYNAYSSLEEAFLRDGKFDGESSLIQFHNQFFDLDFAPKRTRKHVATPSRKSACKRICLFLKWMVRNDRKSGDMGLWKCINKSDLFIPVDVHVMRTCITLGITSKKQVNWSTVEDITEYLKVLDNSDPVKYDYPLFIYSRYSKILDLIP